MENKLNELFARQKFFGNKRLAGVVDDVQKRYFGEELSDNELELVSAAGELDLSKLQGLGDKNKKG